jgi:isoleucyl-tRNA synthetase
LWTLQKDARRAYEAFAFHEGELSNDFMGVTVEFSLAVVASLSHFINVTLSSLYFDVNKDVLYADPVLSKSRIAVLYVLQSVSIV